MSVMARTVDDLTAYACVNRVKYLFFWGHQPERDGSAGAGCLSQWWPSRFAADGHEFATAEHYMMWRKAVLFGDEVMAGRILAAPHPKVAKALGGRVANFRQDVWNANRYEIVVSGNRAKFTQHDELRDFLLTTGERVLVEASPLDRIWGIGLGRDDPRAADPRRWRGTNLLGFALMDVREELSRR
ncbi:MAG: NADAR family protein [Actinomycetota bacterium]|nr:NADAR family protein [Actinomycetota bacterium]